MSSKYQREIEEILKNSDETIFSNQYPQRSNKGSLVQLITLYTKHALSGKLLSASAGRVMLAGLLLMLSMLIMMQFVPGIPGLLAWAGLLIFIAGYGMVLAKPPKIEKRWRGQPIEHNEHTAWNKLRRRFRGK